MNICIFEDNKYSQLYPLSLSRPTYMLKTGISTLSEKITAKLNAKKIYYYTRNYLKPILINNKLKILPKKIINLQACLFINGRLLMDNKLAKILKLTKKDRLFYYKNVLIAARLSRENLKLINNSDETLIIKKNKIKKIQIKANIINYPWDLINNNKEQIAEDALQKFKLGSRLGTIQPGVNIINKKNVYLGKNSALKTGVAIDATEGPVIIDQDSVILPNSIIVGPAYIGKKCLIRSGAKIYSGTTVGNVSKVGGEVEESIIHSYSNKQHEGFLGHAYIGSWCNLGADTNNSDLKNNYSAVTVIINGKKINTGLTFVGLYMGDHSKTGINTMINTGTVIGFCSNVFGAGFLPKYVPSFSWLDAQKGNANYRLNKAISVAKKVMQRREKKLSKNDENILKTIYKITEPERDVYENKN